MGVFNVSINYYQKKNTRYLLLLRNSDTNCSLIFNTDCVLLHQCMGYDCFLIEYLKMEKRQWFKTSMVKNNIKVKYFKSLYVVFTIIYIRNIDDPILIKNQLFLPNIMSAEANIQ